MSIQKFLQRAVASFLNNHGYRFDIDSSQRFGARLIDLDNDDLAATHDGSNHEKHKIDKQLQNKWNFLEESRKKKKWQVIVPLAILGKLMHMKMMLMKILFGIGAIQVILVGGGALLYYYLKHKTLCKFEPHLMHSHSHVSDSIPPGIV